jgi:hypothetical protein
MLPSGQKLTLGLLATITLEVVPFYTYTLFPALLPFLKCILEVVFFDGVQHHLQFCLDHLNCAVMEAYQFYLQSGKQRKVGCVRMKVMLFLVKNSLVKIKCEMVCCRNATLSFL